MIEDNIRDSDVERYSVPNLARALRVIELLSESPRGMGISEIADRLKVPKNSVFRILATLHIYGYVDREEGAKTYRLSSKLLALGFSALVDTSLLEKASDILRQLRDLTGETTLLGTLTKDMGIVLDEVPAEHPVKVQVSVGTAFPLHTAAPAKAMMAFLPAEERERLIGRCSFYRFNARTIVDASRYRMELEQIRQQGYSVDASEELEGVNCVGAPVLNYQNRPIAAIWVTGPEARLKTSDFPRVGLQVAAYAAKISERMGYLQPRSSVEKAADSKSR